TFPLVEGQRDRFALVAAMGHPPRDDERQLLLGSGGAEALDQLEPVADLSILRRAVATVHRVHCSPGVADYVIDLAATPRPRPAGGPPGRHPARRPRPPGGGTGPRRHGRPSLCRP